MHDQRWVSRGPLERVQGASLLGDQRKLCPIDRERGIQHLILVIPFFGDRSDVYPARETLALVTVLAVTSCAVRFANSWGQELDTAAIEFEINSVWESFLAVFGGKTFIIACTSLLLSERPHVNISNLDFHDFASAVLHCPGRQYR